jgi:glycosyltransferase involved in cell wall biosynthesis
VTAPRLLIAVTHPVTARVFLHGQLGFFARQGWEVGLVTSPGPDLDAVREREPAAIFEVPMAREIAPLADLRALAGMRRAIAAFRPDLVAAGTPKAGLLGMLAARRAGVPARLYTVRGLRLETATGARRRLLTAAEWCADGAAHRVVCVSASLRRRYLELGLGSAGKTVVLGAGSSNGVDVERFRPRPAGDPEPARLRERLGLPEGVPVIGFVGRFTRDKGIADLVSAFLGAISVRHPEAHLLLVGDFEAGDPVPERVREALTSHPRVVRAGFVADTAAYYPLIDVLALPSYREGFPNAPLEAAASALPVVGYAATGTVDAVADGETGTLVPVGDSGALGAALLRYLDDPDLARDHGAASRSRVARLFRRELVWELWEEEFRRLLDERRGARGS